MSTTLADCTSHTNQSYTPSYPPPQLQSITSQLHRQLEPQVQSGIGSETFAQTSQPSQVTAQNTSIKLEPKTEQPAQPQQEQKDTPHIADFNEQSAHQRDLAAGASQSHANLTDSSRIVADYTGSGQFPEEQLSSQRATQGGLNQSQPDFSQQIPSQSQALPSSHQPRSSQVGGAGLTGTSYSLQPPPASGPGNPYGHLARGPAVQTDTSLGVPASQVPGPAGQLYVQNSISDHNGPSNGKQVSTSDIQRVQNYIEKCLQMYLTQKEVITQLQQQFKIEPCFTQLVWQKLEEQNQEFFRAYYTRLKLKDQIVLFNHLLDEQVKMFERMPRSNLATGHTLIACQASPATSLQQQAVQPTLQNPAHLPASAMANHVNQAHSISHIPVSSDATMALASDAHQLDMSEFPELGMDSSNGDLNPDLAALAQSLPFSGSDMNLAGMVSLGSMGRGLGSQDHLAGLPRNFSLSDLALDHVTEGDHAGGMMRNISLSDFPALDLDSGGEQS